MNRCLVTLSVAVIMTFSDCQSELSNEALCVSKLKGRIVSDSLACAGIAIEILSGTFDPMQVDSRWQNALQPNSVVYQNVFKTYPYCSSNEEQLKKFEDILETGGEFYFVFTNREDNDCAVCKPLVSLPEKTNQIEIVDSACKDVIIVD
jgi:hypothetical protein